MNKKYHFIGIGGIGMGALASLLLDKGCEVSGSDIKENGITTQLREKGVKIRIGHDAKNVDDQDMVIFSSAVAEDNPELMAAQAKGILIKRRAELLAELMKEHIGITVAGAHGKTTTTSMVATLLTRAGLNPTTAVGGIVNETASNAMLGSGDYFVAEVDESDGSFLNFSPDYSIITNIDLEHLDYYHSWDNIVEAYRKFIDRTKKNGLIIACGEDEKLVELLKKSGRPYHTYGLSGEHYVWAQKILFQNFGTHFECVVNGKNMGDVLLSAPGQHNVLNALACITLGIKLSIDFEMIAKSLKAYRGVQRRFQLKAQIDNIHIIDDYAHHPTEIKTTLATAQTLKKDRLIAVFQPHRYTRVQSLMKEFARSLIDNDYLIVTDIYAASEQPIENVSGSKLVEMVQGMTDKPVVYLQRNDIIDHLMNLVKPGDYVLTLGAGDITRIADEFVLKLTEATLGA